MALVLADRVKDTTTTTGTGAVTLSGTAPTGFQNFSVIGNGNTTYYTIAGGSEWEVGIGTYTASGTTLSRDTVLASSAGGTTKVTFSAGTKDVFVTYPAERSVNLSSSALTSGRVPYATTNGLLTDASGFTFNGTALTFPSPFTLGSTSVTTTGTQLNYLNAATGTTGTTSSNVVFSASPTLSGTVGGALTFSGALTLSAALTYGGVTLSNSVTGTGSMVLGTSPTISEPTCTSASANNCVILQRTGSSAGSARIYANSGDMFGVNDGTNYPFRVVQGASTDTLVAGTASVTVGKALVYGGVTLSNAVTGTGNMVLSASPTLTGTLTAAAGTFSGAIENTSGGIKITANNPILRWNQTGTGANVWRWQANVSAPGDIGIYNETTTSIPYRVTSGDINTFSTAISYGGVTLSNSVTGTGSMVLSASPTLTGTLTAATANFSGAVTQSIGSTSRMSAISTNNGSEAAFVFTGKDSGGAANSFKLGLGITANSEATLYDVTNSATVFRYLRGGAFTFTPGVTMNAALTYGGVTLSNSVTGTGSMALSASPTFTGTLSAATGSFSGNVGAAAVRSTGGTGTATAGVGVTLLALSNSVKVSVTNLSTGGCGYCEVCIDNGQGVYRILTQSSAGTNQPTFSISSTNLVVTWGTGTTYNWGAVFMNLGT